MKIVTQVNGSPTSEAELSMRLRDAIAADRLLHPKRKQDHLILEVMPNVSGQVLDARLDVAYDAGFRFVQLTSGGIETIRRPFLGMLSRVRIMGTSIGLARAASRESSQGTTTPLRCIDFDRFSDLLLAAVLRERAGENVILNLGSE